MKVVLDTNVLLRLVQATDSRRATVRNALDALAKRGDIIVIFPQSIYEAWTALTRPVATNGFGLSPATAAAFIADVRKIATLLPDPPDLADTFIDFVERHAVTGPNAYDARLAAAAESHGVPAILTFNARDFRGLGLTVLEPDAV